MPRVGTLDGIDLTDLDNFASGFPHQLFERHRAAAPVWWHEPTEHTPDGEGFWSVATHAEVLHVLKDPVAYSSERGGDRPYGGTLLQDLPIAGVVLNMMDDPRHGRIRRLVSKGLTPQTVRHLEDELRRRAGVLLDAVPDGELVDFLTEVAAELPMQMICILLGVPEDDRHVLFAAVEPGFDFRSGNGTEREATDFDMTAYGRALIAEKRAHPTDDMLSVVVHASLDDAEPPTLTDDELYAFFSLLFAAGAETTRNAIAGGLAALVEHPDQLDALRKEPELMTMAVEEVLRWTTPSPSKRRTATRATELAGQSIAPGDKVLVWEGSANRDERVFADSMTFDVRRDPNPHLGFGHGVHFCLGANLAKLEIRVLYEELLSRFMAIEPAGPVEWTRSNRHTGVRHLPLVLAR
ncbi:MAG: putative cytochrome [Acidimicrobiales bacterium]|nr:putative cytochrome [Acidimicrobiales bacterium]